MPVHAKNWTATGAGSLYQAAIDASEKIGAPIDTIVWVQGEDDANAGVTADAYGDALADLTARLRADLGNVPFLIQRLLIPAFAFLTLYSLLVIIFACIYRLLDWSMGDPMLAFAGVRRAMSFSEALYFSVVTLSTIGYGDVVPVGPAARTVASIQTVCGVLLLLFGFAEIMRASRGREEH